MARKREPLTLSNEARSSLKALLSSGVSSARKLRRVQILLNLDQGEHPTTIANLIGVSIPTVYGIRNRYKAEGWESAIEERSRPGKPREIDGKARAAITALACSHAPEGYQRWSLRLLADRAVKLEIVEKISHEEVRQILKKTNSSLT